MSTVTLTAGQFANTAIENVPSWYIGRLLGDTTNDGLTLSSLTTGDTSRIQFEALCKAEPDWRKASLLRDSILKFAGTTYTVRFATNSEEINLAAATSAAAVASTASLLPASSVILGVKIQCTQTFTVAGTVTAYSVGDSNLTAAIVRFFDSATQLTVGESDVRILDWVTNATDDYTIDANQSSASTVKILVNGNTTLGKVRVTVLYALVTS